MSVLEPPAERRGIERYWLKQLPWYEWPVWMTLAPPALAYALAMAARAGFWRIPGMRSRVPRTRVVSVGNLSVGGNGKTPMTLHLARALRRRGVAVGIVSRGYGGTDGGGAARLVSDGREVKMGPAEAGDEPVMMAKSFDGPIAIAGRRIDAIHLLQNLGRLDLVLLDDGFQHMRCRRDVDVLVVNFERGFQNGWTLPAGPLRERLGAARRAQIVVVLSTTHGERSGLSERQLQLLDRRRTVGGVVRPGAFIQSINGRWHETPIGPLSSRRVVAVSGLANSRGFHDMLRELEADLVAVLEYPDHYDYTTGDWQEIIRVASNADMVITTEKDLVKLERYPFARDLLYALRLEISMGANEARLIEAVAGFPAAVQRAASHG